LVGAGTDFNTSDKNVSKFSGVPFGSDGSEQCLEVIVGLDVKACVPLAVLVVEGDLLGHGKLHNELWVPMTWQKSQ
jgi:hypothetical protein